MTRYSVAVTNGVATVTVFERGPGGERVTHVERDLSPVDAYHWVNVRVMSPDVADALEELHALLSQRVAS